MKFLTTAFIIMLTVAFLCMAPAETNIQSIVGLAIYCTSNAIVKGFRGLTWTTLNQVPDARNGFVVRAYEDRLEGSGKDAMLKFPMGISP